MCISFEISQTVIISYFHNYIIQKNIITLLWKISKTVWKIFLSQILKKIQIWPGIAENGVGQPKMARTLMKHSQIGYVWSAISKTVFKIFLDQKSRKIWIFQYLLAENGVGRPKTAKPLMKHGQIGYVWRAISKTVFKIFLVQKSRKLWIFQYLL